MKENLSLLAQLIDVSKADGDLDEMEYALMLNMAKLLGLSREQLDELLHNPVRNMHTPKSEFDRILQFHRLVLLSNVDTQVTNEEMTALRQCGLHLKLRPEAVEAVLAEMRHHENGMIPTEIMLQIFQRYHN
jgi:uncharacterized tellurite resistance protein B-like protein